MIDFVNKAFKDSKKGSKQVVKICEGIDVIWQKETKLYDYAFFDSEIGTNDDWAQTETGKWYLKKYEDKFIFFVRSDTLTFELMNNLFVVVAGLELQYSYGSLTEYSIMPDSQNLAHKGKDLLIDKKVEDNTYKTYVFVSDGKNLTDELRARANNLIQILEKQQDL